MEAERDSKLGMDEVDEEREEEKRREQVEYQKAIQEADELIAKAKVDLEPPSKSIGVTPAMGSDDSKVEL